MELPPYPLFPILSSGRIILRELVPADLDAVVEISTYDGRRAETVGEAGRMLEKIRRDYLAGSCINWGIAEKSTGRIVGCCGYYRGFANETGELGCILKVEFRGLGYMTEAMSAAILFGKSSMGLKRIVAVTTLQNLAAQRLLERLGFARQKEEDGRIAYTLK